MDLYTCAIFWKKWTSSWKMWTFMRDFLKKVDLNLKNVDFYKSFSGKKVALYLRKGDFYAWFSEKCGPRPEKCEPLCVIFWKKCTSIWEMWTFYAWFSEKRGPLCTIFWKKWTLTRGVLLKVDLNLKNMDLYMRFLKKGDLDLRNVVLYTWFPEKSGPE